MAKRNLGFEAQLKELEQIVERLEQGDISLEESLKLFEKGVQLARTCEQMLQQAEQKIQILVCHEDNTLQLKPFQIDDQPGSGTS
ncbi:MAG: exodeoxyribonuclease VII small subunit [Methylohalobius sp.]|nr:exodeoxyribonuclease VII small subunit [Methylohalobius sp.]